MFRNQYDSDVTVFSPQGRLFQVEYALEAVKQGAPCVGIATPRHAILVAMRRSPGDLSAANTRKLFPVAAHIGVSIAGLTSDARVLIRAMQKAALSSKLDRERDIPVSRLVTKVAAEKAQEATQYYGGRPFGVGLLVIGRDETKTHLYEFSPAGTCQEWLCTAIGARSQSARTYLENHADVLTSGGDSLGEEELVRHALLALRDCLPPEQSLSTTSISIGHVSAGSDFRIYSDEEAERHLSALPPVQPRSSQVDTSGAAMQE